MWKEVARLYVPQMWKMTATRHLHDPQTIAEAEPVGEQ